MYMYMHIYNDTYAHMQFAEPLAHTLLRNLRRQSLLRVHHPAELRMGRVPVRIPRSLLTIQLYTRPPAPAPEHLYCEHISTLSRGGVQG